MNDYGVVEDAVEVGIDEGYDVTEDAGRTPQSRHGPGEFIVGNIFTDPDIAARLDACRFAGRYEMGANPTCRSCGVSSRGGGGLRG